MQSLNILYFLVFTYYCLRYLMSPGIQMKSPLDSRQKILFDGPEACFIIMFSTGLMVFTTSWFVDVMALRLMAVELICIIGLFVAKRQPVWSFPLLLYFVYLLWILAGCTYSESPVYGLRVFLKYLFPFAFALFASVAVRHAEVVLKACKGAFFIALLSLVASLLPALFDFLFPGLFIYPTARAIHYISLMILALAFYFFTDQRRRSLLLAFIFMLPCFLWVFRTSIMGTIVALSAFSFIRYRTRSLPILVGLFLAGVIAVFTIPSLHKKMFKEDQEMTLEQFERGEVTMKNVNTNARAALWKYLEGRFYEDHQAIGSGTGTVQHHLYTNYLFEGITAPHSDFVQMKCDNGLIGLILYLVMVLAVFVHCFRSYWYYDDVPIRICAIVAGASILGVLSTFYSENTVNYSMSTLSLPFGFYGAMLGLIKGARQQAYDLSSNTAVQ